MIYIINNEDFHWAMGLSRYTMRILGVWPESDGKVTFPKTWQVPLELFAMTVGIGIPQLYAEKLVINQLPIFIGNLAPLVAVICSLFILFIMWRNKNLLFKILSTIAADWVDDKQIWEREIMTNIANRGRIIVNFLYGLMFYTVLGVIIGPAMGIHYRIINNITDYGDRHLPVQTVYPYDVTKTPNFELTVLCHVVVSIVAAMVISSPATMYCLIVHHMCAQLAIIGTKMKNLQIRPNDDESFWTRSKNGYQQELAEIVSSHAQIIRTVARIERYYKMVALVQLSSLSVYMCCWGFQLVNALDGSNEVTQTQLATVIGTFINFMGHSFVYCFSGEKLVYYSENILHCVASSEWYTFPAKKALDLQMIMLRANEPLRMSAGKMIFLNLSTFCNIIKSTAGYISMLIVIRDK